MPLADRLAASHDYQRVILRLALNPQGADAAKVAHHIIPLQALNEFPELARKAAEGGFNINGMGNGALLDTVDHLGNHTGYSKAVFDELRKIDTALEPEKIAAEFERIADLFGGAIADKSFLPIF